MATRAELPAGNDSVARRCRSQFINRPHRWPLTAQYMATIWRAQYIAMYRTLGLQFVCSHYLFSIQSELVGHIGVTDGRIQPETVTD